MVTTPRLGGSPFLTDAGMETWLVFKNGFDLPCFASFTLLDDPRGVECMKAYYRDFIRIAEENGTGLVLDAPTWRANPDWGAAIGFDRTALASVNRSAIGLIAELREESSIADQFVLNLAVGPRGDGYRPDAQMSAEQARDYHRWQIACAAEAGADLASALTMNYVEEAQGIAAAAAEVGIPCVISFTVETDGRLPTGMSLGEALRRVDDSSRGSVSFYMINCAHPSHFAATLGEDGLADRIGAIRVNASRLSHAELDEAEELDDGDPDELASDCQALLGNLPHLCMVGGCCGTDHRHVAAIARECLPVMHRNAAV